MNEFILKVMRYIDNPELFTNDEMMKNGNDAYAAAYAAATIPAAFAAYAAYSYADVDDVDATHAYAADAAKYFKITGENKQNYTDEVERLK